MSPTARPTCFQISNWVIAILPVESILRRRGKTASSSKLYDLNSTTKTAQFPYVFLETSQNICTYPSFAADHWESVLENIRQKSDLWKNLEQLAFIILIRVIFLRWRAMQACKNEAEHDGGRGRIFVFPHARTTPLHSNFPLRLIIGRIRILDTGLELTCNWG